MLSILTLAGIVLSRSARMRVQLMPLRARRLLRKTLSSRTWAFSGLRMTASKSACCLADEAIWERSWATSRRTSADWALSALARVTRAASEATRRRPTTTEATNIARSRRNGWEARLMGIFISIWHQLFLEMDRRYPSKPALFSPGAPRGERRGSTATPNSAEKRLSASAEDAPN